MKKLFLFSVFPFLLFIFFAMADAGLDEGFEAYRKEDYATAFREWSPLAEVGNALAQISLGGLYYDGNGVPKDYSQAFYWFGKAADQGDSGAQGIIGMMYYHGIGVPQHYVQAFYWNRKSAEQGGVRAQYWLGIMYTNGHGTTQDFVLAYMWFNLAAAKGDNDAIKNRDQIAKQLNPNQIAKAQEISRNWRRQESNQDAELNEKPPPSIVTENAQTYITGTGFFVNQDGYVITNYHVIEKCQALYTYVGTEKRSLSIIKWDKLNDLALLKLDSAVSAYAKLRKGRPVQLGEEAVILGFPLRGVVASEANLTTGVVSALAGPDDDPRMFQITAPVQLGNSGGPMVDSSGNVIGVVVGKLDDFALYKATGQIPQNVNFAINSQVLKKFLDANGIRYEESPSAKELKVPEIGAAVKKFTIPIEGLR